MTTHSTLPGGAPPRARSSKANPPCVAYGELDGERIARVFLQGGGQVVISARIWDEMVRLGYARCAPRLITNHRGGSCYVALSSSPDRLRRGHTLTVASLALAILAADGVVKLPPRWKVRTRNGDPLDLRTGNLEAVPAERGRSAWRVLADVRKRRKLVAAGLDPNRVYAERRRAALEASYKGRGGMSEAGSCGWVGGTREDTTSPSYRPAPQPSGPRERPVGGGQ